MLTINVYVGTAYTQLLISSTRNFKVTLNKDQIKDVKVYLRNEISERQKNNKRQHINHWK